MELTNRSNSRGRIYQLREVIAYSNRSWKSAVPLKCAVLSVASKGFQEDVIRLFSVNRISGEVLPQLNDGDLKELGVAALGDRKLLLKLFKTVDLVVENSTRKVSATCMQYECLGGLK